MLKKQFFIISVCIITYKRPKLLGVLLDSLANQTIHKKNKIEIIVVDNDANMSAQTAVHDFSSCFPKIDIVYEVEPLQGIPQARNHSVRLARGEYVAFIDDDEKAEPSWLENLYESLHTFKADAVFGPVVPILPLDCPNWIKKGSFFNRPRHQDGSSLNFGRTGNALVQKKWLKRYEYPFNRDFRLTGGEDSDFFSRMLSEGAKLCWSENALVNEFVGMERLNIKWLVMRAFRGGQVYASRKLRSCRVFGKINHLFYRFVLCSISLIMSIITLPFGRYRSVWWLRKAFSNAGQLSAFLPFRHEEYKPSNYR